MILKDITDLVSIVVPVYNVEKYLSECIDSILAQTYKNFELILIDDGSPDNCPKICDEYAKKDNRIIVIHQKNKGVSNARNAGIKIANGKWIMFVDSDDWIDKDMLEYLLSGDLNCDVIVCGIEDYSKRLFKEPNMEYKVYDLCKNKDLFEVLKLKRSEWRVPFAKIYKRQCIEKNCIFFDEVAILGEDQIFNLEVYQSARKIQLLKLSKYHYRLNYNSACNMLSDSFTENSSFVEYLLDLVHKYKFLSDNLFKQFLISMYMIMDKRRKISYVERINLLKKHLGTYPYSEVLKSVYISNVDFKYWIVFLFFKCHFYFGIYSIYHIKEFLKKVKYKLKG